MASVSDGPGGVRAHGCLEQSCSLLLWESGMLPLEQGGGEWALLFPFSLLWHQHLQCLWTERTAVVQEEGLHTAVYIFFPVPSPLAS